MLQIYNPNILADVPVIEALLKEQVGCTSADFGVKLKLQLIEFKQAVVKLANKTKPPIPSAEEWNALRPDERDAPIAGRFGYLRPAEWWRSKAMTWPNLAPIALWHLSFPTSSISIERVFARMHMMFARMRMMAVPQRLSASPLRIPSRANCCSAPTSNSSTSCWRQLCS